MNVTTWRGWLLPLGFALIACGGEERSGSLHAGDAIDRPDLGRLQDTSSDAVSTAAPETSSPPADTSAPDSLADTVGDSVVAADSVADTGPVPSDSVPSDTTVGDTAGSDTTVGDTDVGPLAGRRRVLIVGVDGLRPDALAVATTPTFDRLISEGAYSDSAKCGDETWSGPGWSTVLTGVWRDKHGVNDNLFLFNDLEDWPDVFGLHQVATGSSYGVSVVAWVPVNDIIVSGAASEHTYDYNFGGDAQMVAKAKEVLAGEDPDITLVLWEDVDTAGHSKGFSADEPAYISAIEDIDRELGELLEVIAQREAYDDERWLVIATTDHGGSGRSHGDNTPDDRTIFFLVHGDGVAPGPLWPAPRQVDLVPTVLAWLGVSLDPAWLLDGRPVGLVPYGPEPASYDVNLVFNGDAEYDRGFESSTPDQVLTGWRDDGSMTAVRYGGSGVPSQTDPGSETRGEFFIEGGRWGDSTMDQRLDLRPLTADIDAGIVGFELSAWLGGKRRQGDAMTVTATFLAANGIELSSAVIGPVTAGDRDNRTGLWLREAADAVPVGTREVTLRVDATVSPFGQNDAYADDIRFVVRRGP